MEREIDRDRGDREINLPQYICVEAMCSVRGFPDGSDSKESAGIAGDRGSIPGSGSFPGGGHGNLLSCSSLKNYKNRGVWQATAHGVPKSWTQLSN